MNLMASSRRIHLALSGEELRLLAEALEIASAELLGRAAAHRACKRYAQLGAALRTSEGGHELAAEMDERDAQLYWQMLIRLDAALGGRERGA